MAPEPPPPGLDRRDFLRLGLAAGPAALVAACGWDGGALLRPRLAAISRVNDWVGEHVFLSPDRLAPTYPESARAGRLPNYHISDATPRWTGPGAWTLAVGGLVRRPMRFTLAQLEALPRTRYTVKHHCVEGWTAIATWAGVPLHVVAGLVEPTAEARYLRVDSFDDGYMNGWDLTSALHPQTILAYAFDDRPLTPEHGAPLRLYSPLKLGYKLTKYVTALTFTRARPTGYWEDRGYPWLGGL
ncbi:MAG TPA: molybdopterin-dependent oxidoreductase [Gemmatimonadales bacterium]|nr:molybdopterin-dependent oxidoreductase [Gemmatimonadales bacterium]